MISDIPDILLVSSLFWEGGDLKSLKLMDSIYNGKLFIDREFYKIEGGIFKEKSLEEVERSGELKGIKSIGILFLSTISDENSVRFIDIIDRELKYLVKHLEKGPLRDLKGPLIRAALHIFLHDKLSINMREEVQTILEGVLSEDSILSNIQYFHVIKEKQAEGLILQKIELPDNSNRENYVESLIESLINITSEILSIFPQNNDPKELAYRFYKIINSLILNQLIIYIQSGYRSKQATHKIEESIVNTIELIVNKLLLPHLDFVQSVMPSYTNIKKLREVFSSINEIYRKYAEKIMRMEALFKSLGELKVSKSSDRGEAGDDFDVKFFTHLVRDSGIASLIYANSVIIPYLHFIVSIFHYLIRADMVYFFTNLYNFVNMMDQVDRIMNTFPYFLAIPSDGRYEKEKEEFLSKLYKSERLDTLNELIKIRYFRLSLKNDEKSEFYKIKSGNLKYHLKSLRNSFSITHGILPVIPIMISEEILNEKFIHYLKYYYGISIKLSYSINKISSILREYIQDYAQRLKNLVDILRTDLEEFDSLKVLEDLLGEVEEIRGYLRSLAEDISELHNKMKQIAENEDSFIKEINEIVERMYIYIPEFFIISRIQNGIGSSEAKQ